MTEIYINIVARIADYMATHPYEAARGLIQLHMHADGKDRGVAVGDVRWCDGRLARTTSAGIRIHVCILYHGTLTDGNLESMHD